MYKINKQNLIIIIAVVFSALIIFFAISYTNGSSFVSNTKGNTDVEENVNNVSIVGGKQIIEIKAKGGFSPTHSIAKAGIPTILRINTNGTFDCSSAIRIPSMNITQNLPMSGTTDVDLGIQKETKLEGTCSMGMYPFDIDFRE